MIYNFGGYTMKKTFTFCILLLALIICTFSTVSASSETAETIPIFELPAIKKPYQSIDELGIDFETIDAYFPEEIEVRYENNKIYVEDIGALSSYISYSSYVVLELIDGYWTADIGTDSVDFAWIHLQAQDPLVDESFWAVAYNKDGIRDPYIALSDGVSGTSVNFAHEFKTVSVRYSSEDYYYEDGYKEGVLDTHGVSNINDPEVINEVVYGSDGNIKYCKLYVDTYYYYFPGQGWSSNWGVYTPCAAPAGYEDKDETYFTANKPSLICTHIKWDDATCTTPKTCAKCGETEGEPLGHDYDDGVITTNPSCSTVGTKTFTCTRDSEHTYTEDVAIDENAHAWNEGIITTNPTCAAVGTKTFTCTHNNTHTRTEDVSALGHKYDNACDATCNVCAEQRTPAEHFDKDGEHTCDECGAVLSEDGLSGGAIAGIAVGSVSVVGLIGFALFKFFIKKKIIG